MLDVERSDPYFALADLKKVLFHGTQLIRTILLRHCEANSNLVPRTFTLAWGPLSQGKGPGNKVGKTHVGTAP